MKISKNEEAILRAADACIFGELNNVRIEPGPRNVDREMTEDQESFITLLRLHEVLFASTITIHNRTPVQADIEGFFGNIKFRRKLRI